MTAVAVEEPAYLAWTEEFGGAGRWGHLPAPTIDAESYIDPALDVLAVAAHGEVRYAALDGRRVRVVKGHPPGYGQRRLF